MHKRMAAGIAAGAVFIGGAGASFLIPGLVAAADPSASPAASPSATSSTSAANASPSTSTSANSSSADCAGGQSGAGMGSDDITAAAQALGMSEADLTAALQGGQTLAQVAADQNVDVQTVADAMVAAEKAEIQAEVDAGTITQAQADQQIANLTQHETDELNGTFSGGRGGRGDHHGQQPASTTPTTTSDSTSS